MKKFLFALLVFNLSFRGNVTAQKNRFAVGINLAPLGANTIEVFPEYNLIANLSLRMVLGITNNSRLDGFYQKYIGVKSTDVDGYFFKPGIKYSTPISILKKDKAGFFIGFSTAYSYFRSVTLKEKINSIVYPRPVDTLILKQSITAPGVDFGVIFLFTKKFSFEMGAQSYYVGSLEDKLNEKIVYYLPGLGVPEDYGFTFGFIVRIIYFFK